VSDEPPSGLLAVQDGPVLRLTIDRPGRGNALTYPVITALTAKVREAASIDGLRAVVIEGAGDTFCMGEDIEAMGEWPEALAHRRPEGSHGPADIPQQELLTALRDLHIPTVAAVRGRAFGFGLDLACACDIRVCPEDATFGDDRVPTARCTSTGITWTLPRLIGLSQAMRLLLLGEAIDGAEAERIGLVYRAWPAEEFEEKSAELVDRIAQMATRSWGLVKQQLIDELDMSYRTALTYSMGIRQTNVIEDRAEGTQSFIEKRPPRYTGR
jgi:2-(1,2-epoxy-1,2-dihydrophenyl)acetyl-CoA isomerase